MGIGGFIDIEINSNKKYHQNFLSFNYGRYAFEYILKIRDYKEVHIPYYTCEAIKETLKKLNIKFHMYEIDTDLKPIFKKEILSEGVGFLYTNYFGIMDSHIQKSYIKNLIIDNSQSFFSKDFENADSFNSIRKFFGVPDGSYAFVKNRKCNLYSKLKRDISFKNYIHLLKRADLGASSSFIEYVEYENSIKDKKMMKISFLTEKILKTIDYNYINTKRLNNFNYLADRLNEKNKLKFVLANEISPICYPFLCENKKLKQKLLENNIFVPTYWKSVLKECKKNSWEHYLANYLLPLPIDQRYDIKDMNKILKIIE